MKKDATYLGLPLFRSSSSFHEMQFLVKKVLARIDGWKARLLSKAGRACLIQSNPGASFFDVECKTSDLRLWKAMVKSRLLLNEGICRKIWDGRSTSIWFDSWVPTSDHKPRPLLDTTQGANLDSWFWLGEESGVFTIKSAYHLVKKNTVINHPIWQWKVLWNTPIHARLKLLGWQILSNALPTREKLALAFPILSNHCPICDEGVESSLHLFWECSFAKALWFGSLWGIRTDSIQTHNNVVHGSTSYRAAVFRDCKDHIHAIFSTRFGATNPALFEAQMMVCATDFAAKNQFRRVIFFCDNEVVVTSFNNLHSELCLTMLEGALLRFRSDVLSLESSKLMKINRKQNFMAHNSAKWARMPPRYHRLVTSPHILESEKDSSFVQLSGSIEVFCHPKLKRDLDEIPKSI
ncbi:hypothetical protein F8388_004460 [Cannabis sativa]|uniref:Reverse transcriptase zinc-binding domain-containing protein n=1 Tax=Cannabis sativa TaxID=3483 RepID=A0A7J6HB14_CANSA|nr:hypothetical protein F8388_004460 [Cannabis sativa]